jgi:PEP-CTERM motif-containing protein
VNTSGGGGGGSTPEPSSIMLFGSGILGLAGVLRRKLF